MKEYKLYAKRKPLIEQLPLDTPLGVHIMASSYCNFKCFYCEHSITKDSGIVGNTGWLKKQFMSLEMLERIVSDMKAFKNKVKLLNFAWMGEPLTNPNIADFVKIAKDANVCEEVSIVTNASLLTRDLSDRLIDAGLDRLRISLQGIDAEAYKENCDYAIDFDSFVSNIDYFYKKKGRTSVYIKIMDTMLKSDDDEKQFRKLFEDKCDIINIEHLIPMHNDIEIKAGNGDFSHFGGGSGA